jgi:hypothetical protein
MKRLAFSFSKASRIKLIIARHVLTSVLVPALTYYPLPYFFLPLPL